MTEKALYKRPSLEEYAQLVADAHNWSDLRRRLGYGNESCGVRTKTLKKYLTGLGLATDKLDEGYYNPKPHEPYSASEVFKRDSKASQKTLIKHYKLRCPPKTCSICGTPTEWNGHSLTLILDHVNGLNHDNRLSNLRWVCPNCNSQLPTTGSRNPHRKTLPSRTKRCSRCGKQLPYKPTNSRGADAHHLCGDCWERKREARSKTAQATSKKLEKLVQKLGFEGTGAILGVSGNAVRKRCRKLGLPATVSELKKATA